MGHQAIVRICRLLAATLGVSTPQANSARRDFPRFTFAAIALVAVTACGGGSSTPLPPPPPPPTYSIGGIVSGLDAGQSVVLQLNGGSDLTVSTNATFMFATKVASAGAYTVTVAGFPAGKTCTVMGGAGTASANVSSVVVACVIPLTYSIGGSVSGLVGQGLEVVLEVPDPSRHGGLPSFVTVETVDISQNGEFFFTTHLPAGIYAGLYLVHIQLQPQLPTQRCAVRNHLGVIGAADVTNVDVVCGEFAYVTNSTANTISAFGIDATTGAIDSAGTPVTTGTASVATASTSDKQYVYVANSGSNDVSAFAADPGTGALTTVPGSPFDTGTNPRGLALYSAVPLDTGPYNFPSHVDWYLYVANAGSNSLSAYRIDKRTGVPTPLLPPSYATGTGPSAIAIHPNGQFLYSANAGGSNNISGFQTDPYSGGLTELSGSPYHSGSNVSSLAFGAGGTFLYAADASGGAATIHGFSIAPDTGALTSLTGFPYALPSCTFIVADQTSTYLYATTGTDIRGYSIDATTGALTALSGFPIAVGADVRSVSIDPANQFLYVANGSAGTVTSFTLNAATGALTPMPGSPFAVGTSADFFTTF